MLYREFSPHILLHQYVETYWAAWGFMKTEEYHKILPDGCVDILFSFGSVSAKDRVVPFRPNIIGTTTSYLENYYLNTLDMIGIRFRPGGLTAFTFTPIHEFTDKTIELALTDSLFDDEFHAGLPEMKTVEERIKHLDYYLVGKLKKTFEPERRIIHAVNLIQHSKGQLSLQDVARESCLSPRHLERKFKASIGLSPKAFSNIIRFKSALSYLEQNTDSTLPDIAVRFGYYDKAHLIKEFKKLSGELPSALKR